MRPLSAAWYDGYDAAMETSRKRWPQALNPHDSDSDQAKWWAAGADVAQYDYASRPPRAVPENRETRHYLLRWQPDAYWLIGPFDSWQLASTWGAENERRPGASLNWCVINLDDARAPPDVVLPDDALRMR